MIPVGILTSLVRSAVSEDLTVEYISTITSGSTWDGTHWNRPNVFVGDTGSERVLLVVRGHGSNVSSAGTLFVGSVEAQNLVVSPSRSYAQIWMATLPPSEPSEVTVKHPDGAAMEHYILRLSEPVALVHSVSGLVSSGTTITLPPLTAPTTGLHLAFARRRLNQAEIVSVSPIDNLLVPGHEGVGSKEATGAPVTIQAVTSGSDYAAAAAVSLTKIPEIDPGKVIFDSFNRENWASGLGISDSGHLWKHVSTGKAGIINGMAYRASGYPTQSYLDFGQQDMEVSVREVVSSANFPKLGARLNADGSGGYWTSRNSAGLVKLGGYGPTFPIAPGDRLGLRVVEGVGVTHVSLLINGDVMITWNDSSPTRPTGTHAAFEIGNISTDRVDNFIVTPPNKSFHFEDFSFGAPTMPVEWEVIPTPDEVNWYINTTSSVTRLTQGVNSNSAAIRPLRLAKPLMKTPDHFAQCTPYGWNNLGFGPGPAVRLSGTSRDDLNAYYFAMNRGTVHKIIDGVISSVGSISGWTSPSASDICRLQVQGSTIKVFVNSIEVLSVVDASISTGTAGFITGRDCGFDNYMAGDL